MQIQPKPYLDKLKLRQQSKGLERRLNMSKLILDKSTPFPLGVELKDIDQTFVEWVEQKLYIAFEGKVLPTFKLFSNQRINEYAQTWQHLDEVGNLLMNFKTVTRENNPKKGENQGSIYNVPGDRDYPMFMVPVLQENGLEAYDMYSMKQPFTLDLSYTVSLVTNKYELINEVNQLVHNEFKALQSYIAPNGHAMPMTLEDVSDESEYAIDDRKYYSQSFKIKVKAYIIRKQDFKVTRLPSRMNIRMLGINDKKSKVKKPTIELSEDYINPCCELRAEDSPYYYKKLSLNVKFPSCALKAEFTFDTDMVIESIETNNVYDFVMYVNEEHMTFENDESKLYNGDNVSIEIERDDLEQESSIVINGYDPNVVLDTRYDPESSLDEISGEEEIIFENKNPL